jgi:predicted chitinase
MSISFLTFKENYKSISGSLTEFQAQGIKTILDAWEKYDSLTDIRQLAYILATVKHETANTFLPIAEYGYGRGGSYGKLINGKAYYGRGYVQLTWLSNYQVMTERLRAKGFDVDLVNNPDDVMIPNIAIQIMFIGMHEGLFTGKKLSQYFNEVTEDPISARKIINGKDKAKMIAGYYYEFKNALQVSRNA